MAHVIAIEGLSGVGKSTLAPLVAQRLGARQVPAIPRELLIERQRADASRHPTTRHLFYLWAVARCSQAVAAIDGLVVIESFVGRTMAYDLGMGSCLDINPWTFALRPSLSILVTCDDSERRRRVATRGQPLGYWQQLGEDAAPLIRKFYETYSNVSVANEHAHPTVAADVIAGLVRRKVQAEAVP